MKIKEKIAPVLDKLEQTRLASLKPATVAKATVPPPAFVVARQVLEALDGTVDGDVEFDLNLTVGSAKSTVSLVVYGGVNNSRRLYVEFANGVSVRIRKVLSYSVSLSDAHEFTLSHDVARIVSGLVAWVATGEEASL